MTSITTYAEIKPTYLCIKQHSITKKKYFCKTTKPDPLKYLGSGHYWKNHINKHGKQFVETLWLSDLYYDTSIVEHALHFSSENNIVESVEWANQKPENGLDGGRIGPHSAESKQKMVEASKKRGRHNPCSQKTKDTLSVINKGRKHSEESKQKMVEASKKRGPRKPRSPESKSKMSISMKGKNTYPRSDDAKYKLSSKFFSLISSKKEYNKITLSRYFPEFKQYY